VVAYLSREVSWEGDGTEGRATGGRRFGSFVGESFGGREERKGRGEVAVGEESRMGGWIEMRFILRREERARRSRAEKKLESTRRVRSFSLFARWVGERRKQKQNRDHR